MGDRYLARLCGMLEVMMTAGRSDEEPAIRLKFTDDITRIFAHLIPRLAI
jgi:hypothetical protein